MANPKKPTNLKVLQGTNRKDRQNKNEVFPETEIPAAPDHLSKEALIEWGRITDDLYRLGLLTKIDMASLAAYCQSFGRWAKAEAELKDQGLTITTTNGNVIQNPLVGIANQAMEHMRKHLVEFGMTPASRSKVSVKKSDGGKKTGWEAYG